MIKRILATDWWNQQDPVFTIGDPTSTFSRSYSAYRHYPIGDVSRLESVGNNILRCSWQKADNGLWIRGAHLEPGRTNLNLDNLNIVTLWTKDGVAPSDIAALLPDGNDSVDDVLHEDTSSGFHRCYSNVGTLNPATTYVCSFFVYPINRYGLGIYCNSKYFEVDCQAMTVTGDIINSQIVDLKSGWYYCWASWTGIVGAFFGAYVVAGGTTAYLGEDIDSLALWGLQLEEGEYPSSLIVTGASSVSRTTDSDWQVSGPLPSMQQGWISGKFYITPHTNSAEIPILTLSDGAGASDRIRLAINTSGNFELQSAATAGDPGLVEGGSVMDGRVEGHHWYITFRPGELCLAVDGNFGTSDHVVTIPDNLDTLQVHPSGGIVGDIQMGDKFSRVPPRFLAAA